MFCIGMQQRNPVCCSFYPQRCLYFYSLLFIATHTFWNFLNLFIVYSNEDLAHNSLAVTHDPPHPYRRVSSCRMCGAFVKAATPAAHCMTLIKYALECAGTAPSVNLNGDIFVGWSQCEGMGVGVGAYKAAFTPNPMPLQKQAGLCDNLVARGVGLI